VLRLMLAQWLRLETPPHAVIATGLPLLAGGPRRLAHGVFSALVKRGARLPDAPSLPSAVAARWNERADAIPAALALPPPLDLTLRDAAETALWLERLGGLSLMPGHIRLPRGEAVERLPGYSEGAWWVQDFAAALPARLLGRGTADGRARRALDLCAAPGGKTTHIAALLGGRGQIVAVERHAGRAEALKRTAQRMGAANVEVRTADATEPQEREAYDRVLVDPPCSDLGTLAARPDARWHKAGRPQALAGLQAEILAAGGAAVKPGGTLVYSTCTISPAENEHIVEAFLRTHDGFTAADLGSDVPLWKHPTMPRSLQTLPHRDRTDGFFIAKLVRA
jgi:16S rRNA (cytosine967-C5)-methyltransferase